VRKKRGKVTCFEKRGTKARRKITIKKRTKKPVCEKKRGGTEFERRRSLHCEDRRKKRSRAFQKEKERELAVKATFGPRRNKPRRRGRGESRVPRKEDRNTRIPLKGKKKRTAGERKCTSVMNGREEKGRTDYKISKGKRCHDANARHRFSGPPRGED